MPHFKEFLDPNFLSNIDFIDDKMKYGRKIVTITEVKKEEAHDGKSGSVKEVATLHFKECKALILSPHNFKTILQMTKKVNTDDWRGLRIELYITENKKAFKQLWDVVTVSSVPVNQAQSAPVDYTNQIATLRGCKTLDNLKFEYSALNKAAQTALVWVKDEMKTKLSAQ